MFDFTLIRKTAESLQRNIDGLDIERRQIESDANRLRSAPAARSDMREVVHSWVERNAADFAPAIAERMARRHGTGQLPAYDVGFIAAVLGSGGGVTTRDLDSALCALFPDAMTRALCGIVNAMPWEGEGLPQAQRDAQIALLEDRARKLATQKAELLQSARDAGLDV